MKNQLLEESIFGLSGRYLYCYNHLDGAEWVKRREGGREGGWNLCYAGNVSDSAALSPTHNPRGSQEACCGNFRTWAKVQRTGFLREKIKYFSQEENWCQRTYLCTFQLPCIVEMFVNQDVANRKSWLAYSVMDCEQHEISNHQRIHRKFLISFSNEHSWTPVHTLPLPRLLVFRTLTKLLISSIKYPVWIVQCVSEDIRQLKPEFSPLKFRSNVRIDRKALQRNVPRICGFNGFNCCVHRGIASIHWFLVSRQVASRQWVCFNILWQVSISKAFYKVEVELCKAAQLHVFILGMQYLYLGALKCAIGYGCAAYVLVTTYRTWCTNKAVCIPGRIKCQPRHGIEYLCSLSTYRTWVETDSSWHYTNTAGRLSPLSPKDTLPR